MKKSVVASIVLLLGCGCAGLVPSAEAPCQVATSEILFSEIFVNPVGVDHGEEWIELVNTAGRPIALRGTELVLERGASHHVWQVDGEVLLPPGGVVVFGDGVQQGISYRSPDGTNLLAPLPTDGRLSLACQGVVIDAVDLGVLSMGVSPGQSVGRYIGAQNVGPWCALGDGGAHASTQGTNDQVCGLMWCEDGDAIRQVRPVPPNGVMLSEVLGNPVGVDQGAEWFELVRTTDGVFDLNGFAVRDQRSGSEWRVLRRACLAASQSRWVVGASDRVPGLDFIWPELSVHNGLSTTWEIGTYERTDDLWLTPEPVEGRAYQRRKEAPEAGCFAAATPGEPNVPCTPWCEDAAGLRVAESVTSARLVAFFPNPDGADAGREWIELSAHAGDWNWLTVENESSRGSVRSQQIQLPGCWPTQGVLRLGADGDASLSMSLYNGPATLRLVAGGAVIDAFAYEAVRSDVVVTRDP